MLAPVFAFWERPFNELNNGQLNRELAARIQQFLQDNISLWIGILLAMVVLALVLRRLKRDWFREDTGRADAGDQILQEMHELHAQGEISDEEFRNIKGQVRRPPSP